MDNSDPVLEQLKKLREGRGLTPERIAKSPAVLDALGETSGVEAQEELLRVLAGMDDGAGTRALTVDFAIDLEELLGREPTTKERDFLGERRSTYATLIGREVRTLQRWSDKALRELRGLLGSETFHGQVLVTAGVQNGRLAGIEVMRFERADSTRSRGRNEGYTNPTEGPTPPLLLYGLPVDWSASSIEFVVMFLDEQPGEAWAIAADDVNDICFAAQRFPLDIEDGMVRCRFDNPRNDQVYGVWWSGLSSSPRDLPRWSSDQSPPSQSAGESLYSSGRR